MKFFLDNNLSLKLARGMAAFGEDVVHLQDEFDANTPDEEWLAKIGSRDWILITRDEAIRRHPTEAAALRTHRIGAFLLGGKRSSACQLIQQLVRHWPAIKEHAKGSERPFVYRIPPTGSKLARIPV